MTDDLVAFLRGRLDEDEKIARAASGGTLIGSKGAWSPSPAGDEWEACRSDDGDEELLVALRPGLPRPPEVMSGYWGAVVSWRDDGQEPGARTPMDAFRHAARHDPARVLADVDAKRGVLDLYGQATKDTQSSDYLVSFPGRVLSSSLDLVLRLLALPYSAHPDYQPAWAPRE